MMNSVPDVTNSRYLWDIQRGCLTGYASLRLYMKFMKIKCRPYLHPVLAVFPDWRQAPSGTQMPLPGQPSACSWGSLSQGQADHSPAWAPSQLRALD